ncbi:MAG: hypothetical protein DWB42_17910 [Chloroflexi bacterium]|jgi:hypothetical protein|nr:hypothetical protein [Chloroflexota bacterium]MDL1883430.1 hypothetical protein [Anaerolineae bacterium CFX8]GIL13956.1 MAG: hypothetical protein BroJett038_26760 [Chloroflexota bacterium]
MIYKVSYVVVGGEYPGGIRNETERPRVGDIVQIGRVKFEITEIHEIIPPRDDFQFLHATVKPVETASNGESPPASG